MVLLFCPSFFTMARPTRLLSRDILILCTGFIAASSLLNLLAVTPFCPNILLLNNEAASLLAGNAPPVIAVEGINVTSSKSGHLRETSSSSDRKVIMGFPFVREFKILKERLRTHHGVVNCMVVAESKYSHSGEEKQLYMKEALASKDKPWLESQMLDIKLVHVIDEGANMFSKNNLWGQEVQSRRAIGQGLPECSPRDDDIIIITDADEVLDSLAIAWLKRTLRHGQVAEVPLAWFLYNKCWLHRKPTTVTVAATYKTLRDNMNGDVHNIRAGKGHNLQRVIYKLHTYAGFHCSWCFGEEYDLYRAKAHNGNLGDGGDLYNKMNLTDEKIQHLISNGLWLDGNPHGKFACMETLPGKILTNEKQRAWPRIKRRSTQISSVASKREGRKEGEVL